MDQSLCFISSGNDNNYSNSNNITFTIKDTKLYVSVFTLPAKDNQKLSRLLSKRFERSVLSNEYKKKSENENTTNESRYFLESNFELTDCLFWFIQIKITSQKS